MRSDSMKTYTFPVCGSFGKGDSWDGEFDFVLSDRDAKRLEESARKENRSMWEYLDEDPEIADIEEKVRKAAKRNDYQNLLKDKYFVKEQREWYEEETGKKNHADSTIVKWYMDGTSYSVMYPKELWNLVEDDDE
jgi:hypothetical protein